MNWLQVLGPPILMIIGGIITWIVKSRLEELKAIEEKLRAERIKIYMDILAPIIKLFSDIKKTGGPETAIKQLTSYDYRKTAFELTLFSSDEVVQSYNAIMQCAFRQQEQNASQDPLEIIRLWGKLLLSIRKSLGNKNTKLDELDMLKSMFTDIDIYRKG